MTVSLLAPDERLSPELVLVLPPELRAQVLARLPAPVWPPPRLPVLTLATPVDDPVARTLGRIVVSRATQLAQIFAALTILTLALSVVAHAVR